ncbi:MAG: ComEC/Rec2 family competence protein, partial [Actinomycetes bacterium]
TARRGLTRFVGRHSELEQMRRALAQAKTGHGPVVGVMGVFDDVARRTPSGWREDGQAIYLLGTTRDELDGSEWANLRGHLGGQPPALDLQAEKTLAAILVNSSRDGMIDAAHDLSEGGLAAGLAEAALRFGVGARIGIDELYERDGIDAQQWRVLRATGTGHLVAISGLHIGLVAG